MSPTYCRLPSLLHPLLTQLTLLKLLALLTLLTLLTSLTFLTLTRMLLLLLFLSSVPWSIVARPGRASRDSRQEEITPCWLPAGVKELVQELRRQEAVVASLLQWLLQEVTFQLGGARVGEEVSVEDLRKEHRGT